LKAAEKGDLFPRYVGMAVGVGALGLLGAATVPGTQQQKLSTFLGVAGSMAAGAVALTLKRRAMARGLNWAMGMMAVVFGLRMVLVGLGLVYVMREGLRPVPFTVGFLTVYVALQWVEISYVLAEAKRRGRGGTR
jgi:hypothetical protein